MKKNIFLITLFFLVLGCSQKDRGFQFSEKYNEDLGKSAKPSVSVAGCAFKEVNYKPNNKVYGSETEKSIDELFAKYVTPQKEVGSVGLSGQVKYPNWFASLKDKNRLCQIVENFRNTNIENLTREEQKVFFINAYNVFTIELILKNYFDLDNNSDKDSYLRSVRNINDLDDRVWDQFAWKIGGATYTLNQIEKEVLIPMGDSRIHFAVNCASKGCPPLRNEAFTLAKLDEQLDEMSDFFVTSEAYTYFDLDPEAGNYFEISSIFNWYEQDFFNDKSGRYGSVRKFIVYHLKSSDKDRGFAKEELLDEDLWELGYSNYSWELNEDGI